MSNESLIGDKKHGLSELRSGHDIKYGPWGLRYTILTRSIGAISIAVLTSKHTHGVCSKSFVYSEKGARYSFIQQKSAYCFPNRYLLIHESLRST